MGKKQAKSRKVKSISRKKPVGAAGISLANIWPQERDFMTRPERYKYVRKIVKTQGCVFCSARDQGPGFASLILHRGTHAMAMLNKYPYNNGHVLVLPTRHGGNLLDLSDAEYGEVQSLLRKSMEAVIKCYECSGVNLGLNHGAVAGAGIPDHLHWHVVPRWTGDTNFFPLIAETKVLPEALERTYERLLPYFREI